MAAPVVFQGRMVSTPCPPLTWPCLTPKSRSGRKAQGCVFHTLPPPPPGRGRSPPGSGLPLLPCICREQQDCQVFVELQEGRGPIWLIHEVYSRCSGNNELTEYSRRRGAARTHGLRRRFQLRGLSGTCSVKALVPVPSFRCVWNGGITLTWGVMKEMRAGGACGLLGQPLAHKRCSGEWALCPSIVSALLPPYGLWVREGGGPHSGPWGPRGGVISSPSMNGSLSLHPAAPNSHPRSRLRLQLEEAQAPPSSPAVSFDKGGVGLVSRAGMEVRSLETSPPLSLSRVQIRHSVPEPEIDGWEENSREASWLAAVTCMCARVLVCVCVCLMVPFSGPVSDSVSLRVSEDVCPCLPVCPHPMSGRMCVHTEGLLAASEASPRPSTCLPPSLRAQPDQPP